MALRFRSIVRRLRRQYATVRFGPFRRLDRPGVPQDRFGRFGDGRRVLVAEGETGDETPAAEIEETDAAVDALRDELANHEPHSGTHSHSHSHGDGTTHSHSHFHNGAAVHNHSHGAAAYAGMTETQRREVDAENEITDPAALDALVASLLSSYPEERRAALTAATAADGTVTPAAWHSYLCAEGIRTDDGREVALNACRFPDLPVSLRLLIEDEGGHWGAVTCGRIDSMERMENAPQDGINLIYSEGLFGSDPNGQLAELMVEEQTQRFVSIDPRDVTMEWIEVEVTRSQFDVIIVEDDDDCGDDDDGGEISECWMRFIDLVVGGATIVPMPAVQLAVITLKDVELPTQPIAAEAAPRSSVVASGAPVAPPVEWFDDPGFHVGDPRLVLQEDGRSLACPFTITDDGQVYGHIAWWKATHTGFQGRKVHPPRSKSGYAYYLTGPGVECDDGTLVEGVGQLTMGCGHAGTNLDWKATVAHYDGGYGAVQVADLRAGEDDFGIWIAGALRPGLSAEQLREARALAPSGDWRDIGGSLELVANLLVPVPGFPIRRSLAASGLRVDDFSAVRMGVDGDEHVFSLVAAGRVRRIDPETRLSTLERRLAALAEIVEPIARAEIRRSLDL